MVTANPHANSYCRSIGSLWVVSSRFYKWRVNRAKGQGLGAANNLKKQQTDSGYVLAETLIAFAMPKRAKEQILHISE